jgi:Tfp pilus assembly protein PilP
MPRVVTAPTKRKTGPSVDELKLTGVIWDRRGASALVEAPNGAGYVLHVNDTIGEDARVAKITSDVVTIEVKSAVAGPGVPMRRVELRLRKEE